MKLVFRLAFIALALSGCVTRTNVTSLNVPPGEALAAGKIRVLYNGENVTSRIYFDVKNPAGTVFRIDQNEAGIFFARLPVGSYELGGIGFQELFRGGFWYPFEPARGTFQISRSGAIYDLGEIMIDWTGPGVKMVQYFALVGAMIDVARGNGELTIAVRDDAVEVSEAFRRRFESIPPMERTPLRVAELPPPARPPSQARASTAEPVALPPVPANARAEQGSGETMSVPQGPGPVPILRPRERQ